MSSDDVELIKHLSEVVQFANSYLFPEKVAEDGKRVSNEDAIDGIDGLSTEFIIEEVNFIDWLNQ